MPAASVYFMPPALRVARRAHLVIAVGLLLAVVAFWIELFLPKGVAMW
ncbi:MAG: hypothetical protein JKY65_30510 [Planctomycetes bacterium]|nr:hypothetical protein [Planctomycetota bacterium]